MNSATRLVRRTVTAVVVASLAAPAVATAQTPSGTVPICVATMSHLHYGPNSAGACHRGHSLFQAATATAVLQVNTAVAALRADVDALKTSVPGGLVERVTALETAVTALGARIDEAGVAMAQAVAALTARQDATDQTVAQLMAEMQAELAQARSSIASPNGQYSVTATDAGVTVSGGSNMFMKLDPSGIELRTPGYIRIDAGANVETKAGLSIETKAGLNANISSGAATTVKSGGNLNLEGGAFVTVKGAQIDVTGAMLRLNTGGCPVATGTSAVIIPSTAPVGAPSTGTVVPVNTTVLVPCG